MRPDVGNGTRGPTLADFLAAKTLVQRDEAEAAQRTFDGAVGALADIILSAESDDELSEALDEAFTSTAFANYSELVSQWKGAAGFQNVALGPSMATLHTRITVFGLAAANKLYAADQIWLQTLRLAANIPPTAEWARPAPISPVDVVRNQSFPLELRRLVLATWHGLLASLTLNELLKRRTSHALVPKLAHVTFAGAKAARQFLRGELNLSAHERRERWVMTAFTGAAAGDGYFTPVASD